MLQDTADYKYNRQSVYPYVRLSACGTGAIQSSRLPSNNRNRFNYTFYWESRFLFLSFLGATLWCFLHPSPLAADRIHTFFPLLYCPLFQTTAFCFMVPTPSLFAGIPFFFLIPMLLHCLVIVLNDNFFLLLCHLLLRDACCIILSLPCQWYTPLLPLQPFICLHDYLGISDSASQSDLKSLYM